MAIHFSAKSTAAAPRGMDDMPAEDQFGRSNRLANSRRAIAALAVLVMMSALAAHGAEPASTGVLILHSNQRPTPAAVAIEETLRRVVPEDYKHPVELYSEYLDDEWGSVRDFGTLQAEFLKSKYGARNIRVIVASALPALQFVIEHRDRMLPGAPVVHAVVARETLERMSLPPDIVGKAVDLDPTPTLKMALHLHPEARRLVLVVGATERDRAWEMRLRQAAANVGDGVEVSYLAGLSTPELLRRVRGLPRDAILFTPGYFVDGAGKVFVPRQSAEAIAQAAPVPVYGPFDTFVGSGVVGGYVTPLETQASEAGALVVALLNFGRVALPPRATVATVPMVDWRQVRRWGIDERMLPGDTVVRFREPTAWNKYGLAISLGIAIVVIQAGLIAALLIERRSRLRMAMALEESQKRMTLAARAAKLSVWMWEVARDKIRPAARSSQSVSERPVAFEDVLARAHPADRADIERVVNRALATGEEIDVEYRTIADDGDVRWVAVRGASENGDGRQLFGVAIDITERKRAELRAVQDRNALRHMTRVSMLGQLSASIAHQLNQPLAAILGNAEAARKMLARAKVDLVELREICDDIVTEDNRAAEVIRRLGALYKRGDMKLEALDLNALIRETLELLRAELLIRHVTPIVDLSESLPVIDGGSVQLQQVLLNLVLNAADAMIEKKVDERILTIRTEADGAEVRLCVIDNGFGIRGDDLPHVFDAFWSTKAGGMGIGLAICQSIVAAHHGGISASNNPNGGATFCVSLPVRQGT